jgi:hypothetical protein
MKRILSLFVVIVIMMLFIPVVWVVESNREVVVNRRDRGITNERLAEMVAMGEIPQNTNVLWLCRNPITDFSPLNLLPDLVVLRFSGGQLSDLSSLSGLTNLQELWLETNQITDISPLSGLTGLQHLILSNNQITDITPLANLTNLGHSMGALSLRDNQITDITPLANLTNLGVLDLQNNLITDVTPLQNLTNLWWLDLRDNQIEDVMPLVWLTGLDSQSLRLGGNPVADDTEQLAALRAARSRNAHRTTLTLGHVLGTEPYTVNDALEILRYTVGLPSVLDNCTVAVIAALIVNEEVPDVRDALQILRSVVGLSSVFDE